MHRFCHILVLICFLAGIIAPACGFSWGGKFSVIEICTSEGIESRVIPNAPNDNKNHETSQECQFCFQNAHLKDFLPSMLAHNANITILEKVRFRAFETLLFSKSKTPQSPRAPPALI